MFKGGRRVLKSLGDEGEKRKIRGVQFQFFRNNSLGKRELGKLRESYQGARSGDKRGDEVSLGEEGRVLKKQV